MNGNPEVHKTPVAIRVADYELQVQKQYCATAEILVRDARATGHDGLIRGAEKQLLSGNLRLGVLERRRARLQRKWEAGKLPLDQVVR